jgi:tetratricopeptide (TPR) repeat protein
MNFLGDSGYAVLISVLLSLQGCSRSPAAWQKHRDAAIQAFENGQYSEAEANWRAALHDAEEFDPDGPRARMTLNNLGELYRAEGNYEQAEQWQQWHQRALELREKTLGPDHPNVAASLSSLAETYRLEGEYGKA